MGNIEKRALTPDTQLTFTCFLKKRFLAADGSYIRNEREHYFRIDQLINDGIPNPLKKKHY